MTIQSQSFAAFLFSFKGRITRGQWWCLQVISSILLAAIFIFVGNADQDTTANLFGATIVILVLEIMLLWVGLAATAKRFHDRGKSGWNCLWQMLPVIGTIYVLYACGITENGREPNKYGSPVAKLPN